MQFKHWVGQNIAQAGVCQGRPDGAQSDFLRRITSDDEATNHDARATLYPHPGRNVKEQLGRRRLDLRWRSWCSTCAWRGSWSWRRGRRGNAAKPCPKKLDCTVLDGFPVIEGVIVSGY